MATEKDKEKIRKILAMLEGATSEGEARAASLALQRALASSGLSLDEVGRSNGSETVEEEVACGQQAPAWKCFLANAIAGNFRCMTFMSRKYAGVDAGGRTRWSRSFVFIGAGDDAAIAAKAFSASLAAAENCWDAYRRQNGPFRYSRVRNTYLVGFAQGLADAYDEQRTESAEMALALRVPLQVRQAVDAMDLRTEKFSYASAGSAVKAAGAADGYGFGKGDRIAC